MTRATKKFGHPYVYRPRGNLIKRLVTRLGWSYDAVINQIQKERKDLLKR